VVPILLAAIGATCGGTGAAFQHKAAGQEDEHAAMDPRLMFRLLRRRTWLLGLAISTSGFAFTASAIGRGRLVQVEPVLTLHVLVALLVSARLAGRRLGGPEWRGAVLTMVGVAGFVIAANPQEGERVEEVVPWAVPIAVLAAALLLGRMLAPRLVPERRAVLLGALAGVSFGTADAIIKVISDVIDVHGVGHLPTHWGLYAWLVVSPTAFLMQQSAFHVGHMGAGLPAQSSVQPCTAAFLGAVMFGEELRAGWAIPFELVFAVAMLVGVVALSRSPLIAPELDEAGMAAGDDG
jgi:drug/metabolite transporter (DMT)-like permease